MNAAWGKVLRSVTVVLWFAGAVTLIWYALLWVHHYNAWPRSPQPTVARIYPMNMHGVVVYVTAKERHRMRATEDWLLCFIILGISTGLLHDALFGRDAWKRRGLPSHRARGNN